MPEAIYALDTAENEEYATIKYRYTYSLDDQQTVEYDFLSNKTVILKETPVPHYDRSLYHSERVEATASDGTTIPISVVYRKDKKKAEGQPQALHLHGYGAYERSFEPEFQEKILPLLDRGFVYAIAHVRGGGENGRTWYEAARYLTKMTTFTDFIAVAEHLVATKVTSPSHMTCEGGSAG
ncbi:hypothetical protein AaE_012116, partial [Aphanomyces astaci]